jgi:thiol-disulfide isomerase/thioredoxin
MAPALLVLALFSGTIQVPTVHFFYRPSCGHCMDNLLVDIPNLQKKYVFSIKKYDIDILANYRLLEEMEAAKNTYSDDLPVIFVGDSVFYGPESLYKRLEVVLRVFPRPKLPVVKEPIEDTLPVVKGEIEILYFYQPGCGECARLEALFNNLEKNYRNIHVLRHDVLSDSGKIKLEALSAAIGIPERERLIVPVVVVGKGHLLKEEITSENLFLLFEEYEELSYPAVDTLLQEAESDIFRRFGRFSWLGIAFAGLLDGVNPCAFATIIFFVSYLVFLGRRRRDIVLMAISFIVAVFVAYFLIGVGAYNLLKYLAGYDIVAKIIFICFGVVAFVLGVLSIRDYVYARRGHLDRMILQLPLGIKQRIHRGIKEKTATGGIVLGSFIAGLLISFLEFGCTGQIYLPTITFMISKAGWQLKPVLSLVLYNIMFIVPLVLFALLAVIFTTQRITKTLSARIPAIKLLTAALFFALGVLLILSA